MKTLIQLFLVMPLFYLTEKKEIVELPSQAIQSTVFAAKDPARSQIKLLIKKPNKTRLDAFCMTVGVNHDHE